MPIIDHGLITQTKDHLQGLMWAHLINLMIEDQGGMILIINLRFGMGHLLILKLKNMDHHIVCYQCGEIDHYANELMSQPTKRRLCPSLWEVLPTRSSIHSAEQCTALALVFPPSERDWVLGSTLKLTEIKEMSKDVNHVQQKKFLLII